MFKSVKWPLHLNFKPAKFRFEGYRNTSKRPFQYRLASKKFISFVSTSVTALKSFYKQKFLHVKLKFNVFSKTLLNQLKAPEFFNKPIKSRKQRRFDFVMSLFIHMESSLDIILFRLFQGFGLSLSKTRSFIERGAVFVNGVKTLIKNHPIRPFSIIQIPFTV